MSVRSALASFGGDLWSSWHAFALWPWPAIVFRYPKYRFDWQDYRTITAWIKPGDLILESAEPYFVSNKAISGTAFKHVGIFTGAVNGRSNPKTGYIEKAKSLGVEWGHTGKAGKGIYERTVTHAISDGVVCQDLGELCFHADYIAVVRPFSIDNAERRIVVETALSHVGKDYDFDFDANTPEDFYCSEFGAYCYKKAGLLVPEMVRRNVSIAGLLLPLARFKSDVYIADSFINEMQVVCVSVTCHEKKFINRSQFKDRMRERFMQAVDAEDMKGESE